MRCLSFASLTLLLGLGACATTAPHPNQDGGITRVVEQPMHDLTLLRDQVPPALQKAAAAPYDLQEATTCAQIAHEITELDAVLGPDLTPGAKPGRGLSVGKLAAGAIGGAVHLPYRGLVRQVTGAEKRDRELHAADQAGMVRRGFLKGRLSAMNCGGQRLTLARSISP